MKKFFSLFAAVLFVGSMMAAEEVAYTLTPASTGGNSSPHNSYTAAATTTISGIEWSVLGNSNMTPWRLGGKGSNCESADRDVHSNTAISDNISKIEITHGTADNITVNSMTVIVSKNSDFSNPVSTLTPTFVASDIVTVNRPEGKDWSNCYYKFVYNLSVSGDKNKFIQFSEAVFYKETGGTPSCATPSFSPKAGAVLNGTTVTLTTTTEDADIYYTMGANPADPTSASTKYTAPISITEATTIKAIAVKEGYNNSGVASASYTVVTPLATMQAIFDAASTAGNYYITFSDSWVVTGVTTNGKNVYITDGTKGMILFNNSGNMGLVVGNTLSGTVQRSLKLYSGAAELDGFTTDGLTIGTGSLPSVQELDEEGVAALSGVNTGSLIKISGACTEDNSKLYVAGVQLYNSLFAYTAPTAGNSYNVTGVYAQFNTTKEILPRSAADIEDITPAGAPETPTFSVAAGTYTSVQTVELSCATDGATIYYTTDGSTPDDTKTEYTAAITVGESMTIKAIAIKDDISSAIASAAYVINIEDESTKKTWDLSIDETATASADELTWDATYVDMSFAKGTSSTNANNYYPGTSGQSYTSTRAYKNSVITITPVASKQITTVVFTATTSGYATTLKNAAWTNATAVANDVTVTVTASGSGAISAKLGGTAGFTAVTVNYKAASGTALDNAAVEGKAVKFIENGQLFIEKAGVRYNVMGQIIK